MHTKFTLQVCIDNFLVYPDYLMLPYADPSTPPVLQLHRPLSL